MEEISYDYLKKTLENVLTSNLGRTIAYVDQEIEAILHNPEKYLINKGGQIIVGYINNWCTAVSTAHISTTISIMDFMDNVSQDCFEYIYCPLLA